MVVALFLVGLVVFGDFVPRLVFAATKQLLCARSGFDMVRQSLRRLCVEREFWSFIFDHKLPSFLV